MRRWKWLKRILLALPVIALAMYAIGNYIIYSNIYHPHHHKICCETPLDWGFDYENAEFRGGDNLTLRGWYIPSQNGATVIVLHGYGGSRLSQKTVVQWLAEAGYGVLVYDMRGHGESDGDQRSYGWKDVPDVQGAVDYLLNRPDVEPYKIGIYGHSVGAQVAVRATAEIDELQAVVMDGVSSAFYDDVDALAKESLVWRLNTYDLAIMNQVSSIWLGVPIPDGIKASLVRISPRPVLLIGGTKNHGEEILIRDFYEVAGEPKELWEIPEAGHGGTWKARPDEYQERVLSFFDEALLPHPNSESN